MWPLGLVRANPKLGRLAEASFNILGTYVPSRRIRLAWLRSIGVTIGPGSSVFRGTTVFSPTSLVIGERCSIGFRCLLDARGGINIRDRVVIASDVHLISASHDSQAKDFKAYFGPIHIGTYAWIGSRATVLLNVSIGTGAVAAACATVVSSVADFQIVGGVPARPIGSRPIELDYDPTYWPRFY